MTVVTLIEVVMVAWEYCMKYGRAWWAKQRALKLIYGDWAKAYGHLSAMLHDMKAITQECISSTSQNLTFWVLTIGIISSVHSGYLDNALKPSSIVVIFYLLMVRS
jgi:hypothetical protein